MRGGNSNRASDQMVGRSIHAWSNCCSTIKSEFSLVKIRARDEPLNSRRWCWTRTARNQRTRRVSTCPHPTVRLPRLRDGNDYRGRAVIRRVRFPRHRVDACAVVVRAGSGRCGQRDRTSGRECGHGAQCRCLYRVRTTYLRVCRTDRGVCGAVVAQCSRSRITVPDVEHHHRQAERLACLGAAVGHCRRGQGHL